MERLMFLLMLIYWNEYPTDSSIPVYDKFEHCFPVKKEYNNPFNFSEVNVKATILPPSKIRYTIDGFYYQEYTRSKLDNKEVLTSLGQPKWCLRYSPLEIGEYTVDITITDSEGTRNVSNINFQASKANDPNGFIHVSGNLIHFVYNDETVYFPIGENVCWSSKQNGTYGYDHYFTKLSENAANYARLWLSWNGLAVEIANFKISLPNTWRLDYVVQLAEKLGIKLLMCTESFNCFNSVSKMSGFWNKDCYYNKKFGGIIEKPEDFFTDEGAKTDYKMRLRYLVARYGYSTSVFAWEFFNDVDLTDNYSSENQVKWINEMSSYMIPIDVNKHLISTSFSNPDGDANVQTLSAIDFTMTHNYGSMDIAFSTGQYAYDKQLKYQKPSFVAEYEVESNADKQGIALHNGLWAPIFNMGAGTSMTWWWDSWVDPNDLYPIFKPVKEFVQQISYKAGYMWNTINATTNLGSQLRVSGMTNKFAFATQKIAWIQDKCYTWYNIHIGKKCHKHNGVILTINECEDGAIYTAVWYNTHNGNWSKPITNLRCTESGKLNITAPSFTNDIAILLDLTG